MEISKTTYLSKKGMKDLKKAVTQLERDRHLTILELHEQDKTDGHEERLARIEKLAQLDSIEHELAEKQNLLAVAKPYPRSSDSRVSIGSVVELINASGKRFIYTIVDSIEADPSDGRISAASPLGQSLMGKTTTDTINWGSDRNKNKLHLVRIS